MVPTKRPAETGQLNQYSIPFHDWRDTYTMYSKLDVPNNKNDQYVRSCLGFWFMEINQTQKEHMVQ